MLGEGRGQGKVERRNGGMKERSWKRRREKQTEKKEKTWNRDKRKVEDRWKGNKYINRERILSGN